MTDTHNPTTVPTDQDEPLYLGCYFKALVEYFDFQIEMQNEEIVTLKEDEELNAEYIKFCNVALSELNELLNRTKAAQRLIIGDNGEAKDVSEPLH